MKDNNNIYNIYNDIQNIRNTLIFKCSRYVEEFFK